MSSLNRNSRRGVPVPQTTTSARLGDARRFEPADQCRDDVAVGRMIIVAGTVEVGRHRREEARAVLPVIARAQLDAGDLGERIGAVGRLERPGQQRGLGDRLGGVLGIDAARPEEQQPVDPDAMRRGDHVGLDGEVVADEVGRKRVVGADAADPGGREHDMGGALGRHECRGRRLVRQVELGVRAEDEVVEPGSAQRTDDGAARQPAVPRDVDLVGRLHRPHS